ncbi:MFS transporter [Rufibacter glacialis]|uniref:Peptide MFS transporter n=1 Tax=Rufibacter glacialis TaxID=1259555 RepID=A0A5M8QHD8_9BACT|nr:peptide MFS transporter [Rufibacter glacialis]KAA6434394.1 peptide MFS transporter [Rufibacter glacialis]GGK69191.1 MFS transporter [Rufibacter glacialis]
MSEKDHPLSDNVSKHNIPYGEHPVEIDNGHPPGLFVLFFTEMWERFSYYGMRALFVLFLTSSLVKGGWAWERDEALRLYGIYTGLVYLTPIVGGFIADKFLGYRMAIIIGALLMTLGHASMAVETEFFFYVGLGLIILGNGLFKPNISSMVGQLYTKNPAKKDAAYTIFYMGINSGAFLGILLCGYIGEKVGWSYGFGLAGIFMFFGMLQFAFSKNLFGKIGLGPKHILNNDASVKAAEKEAEEPANVVRDRIIVISVLAFFTIFFWMAFEQAGGSMTIFANDYTNRVLEGSSATIFKWVNALLVVVPMLILTYVLWNLFRQTYKKIPISNLFLGSSFLIIWGIIIWMLNKEFSADATEVPASWFQILNSFFIISLAPIFSKIWESKLNPSGPVKFALGLFLLGIGFGILAYGGLSIPQGAKTASVSMVWLILAYLFHTLGELCVSPVGLSYVSKLSPARLVGLMFGIWFIANFVANYLAGLTGSFIDHITEQYSITIFFLIFTAMPIVAGLIMLALNGTLKKKMHGIH